MATITTTQHEHQISPVEAIYLRPLNSGKVLSESHDQPAVESARDEPPPNAQTQVERWNYPKGNVAKLGFAFLSFIIAGMNDAAVGVRQASRYRMLY